jgi:excisionase family DNA binding protein
VGFFFCAEVNVDIEKLLLTVPEAAVLASVGRSTGYQLVADGEWPSILIGRSVRVPVAGLKAWVEQRTKAASTSVANSGRSRGGDPHRAAVLPRA